MVFFMILIPSFPVVPYEIPMDVHLFISPKLESIPTGILDGIEVATVKVSFSADSEIWPAFQATSPEIAVPVSLSCSDVPDGVQVRFDPTPLLMQVNQEEYRVVGSGESRIYIITEDSAQLGKYDLEIVATCIVNETILFQVQDIFYLSIEPEISSTSMIEYTSIGIIAVVVIIAVIIMLLIRIKPKPKPL